MKLSSEQIDFYRVNGYLKIEHCLSEQEIDLLNAELPNTIEKDSPRVILERSGHVRSVFAPHFTNPVYQRLGRLDKFVNLAEQLIGDQVYIHQYKINCKKGLQSEWWEWHQDFPYWHIDDGIEQPQLLNVMIYLQDTDALNGALLLIPSSHSNGIARFAEKDTAQVERSAGEIAGANKYQDNLSSLNSNIKFTVDHELIRELAVTHPIVTAEGKKGTVLCFHPNIFHASNNNMSPFDRNMVLITYNSAANTPKKVENVRPDFLSGTDHMPITEKEYSLL